MSSAARRHATYADLEALPPHLVGEIIDGELFAHPRPVLRHGAAANLMSYQLTGPFQRGRGGPGGWIFIDGPELHLGAHVIVPDLAGWRTERLPSVPDAAWIDLTPDWVCLILSPSTEALDRGRKRRVYAGHGLRHYWLLNVSKRQLEAYELRDGSFVLIDTFEDDASVTAPPFGEVPFPLSVLLADGPDPAAD